MALLALDICTKQGFSKWWWLLSPPLSQDIECGSMAVCRSDVSAQWFFPNPQRLLLDRGVWDVVCTRDSVIPFGWGIEESSRHIHCNLELLLGDLFFVGEIWFRRGVVAGFSLSGQVTDPLLPFLQGFDGASLYLERAVFGGLAKDSSLISRLLSRLAVLLFQSCGVGD